jgi:hypothetical protein
VPERQSRLCLERGFSATGGVQVSVFRFQPSLGPAPATSLIQDETLALQFLMQGELKNEHRTSNIESRQGVKWMYPINFIKRRSEFRAELLAASCGPHRIA